MAAQKLRPKDLKSYRERLVKVQGNTCPLCELELLAEDAAMDHDHQTGHIRFALHKSCNRSEGDIKRAARFSRSKDPQRFVKRVAVLWDKDFSHNPVHPNFQTADDKREKELKRRKKTTKMPHAIAKIDAELAEIKARKKNGFVTH
jgi:hypothetical protein